MAQKVQVLLVDDVDGTEAAETVTFAFAFDGVSYEIDLAAAHATELRNALAQWVGSARKTSRSTGRPSRTGSPRTTSSSDAVAIREWAKQTGLAVSERGRISAEVKAAYEAR